MDAENENLMDEVRMTTDEGSELAGVTWSDDEKEEGDEWEGMRARRKA